MRFCPFCREAFEDVARCPSCDVALVTLHELGALAAANIPDDRILPLFSARFGRGVLFAGALLTLVAFFCPFGSLSAEHYAASSLFALARARALRLWIVPTSSFALVLLLIRRRTLRALRGARLAALFVSILPSAMVLWTWFGSRRAALRLSQLTGEDVAFRLGFGSWLVWFAGVLLVSASLRLGQRASPRID